MPTQPTFFESALIQVPAVRLRALTALNRPCWQGCRLINPADVRAAVAANHFPLAAKLQQLSHDEREAFNHSCSYDDHVQRIAWLVKHWGCEASVGDTPILMRVDANVATLEDGNHRAVAAILREEPAVTLEVMAGTLMAVEHILGEVTWLRRPTGQVFGHNIVYSGKGESWEVEYLADRLWVNNQQGFCQLQMKLGKVVSSAIVTATADGSGPRCVLYQHDLTLANLVAGCSDVISPVFGRPEFVQFLRNQFPALLP